MIRSIFFISEFCLASIALLCYIDSRKHLGDSAALWVESLQTFLIRSVSQRNGCIWSGKQT